MRFTHFLILSLERILRFGRTVFLFRRNAKARFGLGLVLGSFAPALAAQDLANGREFNYAGCYARLRDGEFVVGNAHVRRAWKIERGQLFATSFMDLDLKKEWISAPSTLPSPSSPQPADNSTVVMRGAGGTFGPTQAASLRVELRESNTLEPVSYEFQVFPEASGIRLWISRTEGRKQAEGSTLPPPLRPVAGDAIEHLQSDKQHLKFTQVTLRDRTDDHNELVFEDEWLLQPNEAKLELQGNIFIVEDSLSGDGFVFLKEAPQPEMRPVKNAFDARVAGSQTGLSKTHDKGKTPFEISFYGHGFEAYGEGYPSVLLTYHGGKQGRIVALQRYQKQLRQYVPGRDGQFISNTWGDRSTDTKLNADFIRKEIDSGKRLGVDIVQVDDGWEIGTTLVRSAAAGVWEGYRRHDPHFWDVNPARFPAGLSPLSEYARSQHMRLGLWFAPDSSSDFGDWSRDADQLLNWNKTDKIEAFKLDSVKIRSKTAEGNYHALLDKVMKDSSGKILLDLDVTAETRQGYFGNIPAGTLFVENRYTDWHRYWPHQTLRNLWKLSQYVDPVRLRIEFLNSQRNASLYEGDPLAPARYNADTLFATTMVASPLGWFENSSLSPSFIAKASPLIATWKRQRDMMYGGTTVPIGEVPDGLTWTGFQSLAEDRRSGYLLVFRELNEKASWTVPSGMLTDGNYRVQLLGGEGSVAPSTSGFEVTIPKKLGFVWAKVEALN